MEQTVPLHVMHDIMALDINDRLVVPEEAVSLLFQIVLHS